ncbi:hypothetical protein FB45DRAFT_928237 [Roridomyces roridus]|uniref:GDP-mannose transporter n=1 Tax=Roridomyces roridus TaxID=1738132 RepID=A0AAD7BHB6_9AGAR|nr:hypothetical protein FB45DRAFT_928237 [Roridomyces roridus]
MHTPTPEPESTRLQVASVVSFYIVAALVMVFVNKFVLSEAPDLPFTFLFIQTFIAVLLLRLYALLSKTSVQSYLPLEKFELPRLNGEIIVALLPYLTVGITGLIFNTLCLANVDTAFFQIARGLLLPFTIMISSIHSQVRPQPKILAAAGIVTAGFIVGSAPTFSRSSGLSRDSSVAIFYGCMSSFVLALHAVLKKAALSRVGQSVVTLSYAGNLFMSAVLVVCLMVNGEPEAIHRRMHAAKQDWTTFMVGSAVTGVFGFLLGLANSLSIKITSPVTHMFSSAARGVIQTLLGVLIFKDIITIPRAYSITLITGGTVYYTWAQATSKPRARFPPSDIEKRGKTEPSAVKSVKE